MLVHAHGRLLVAWGWSRNALLVAEMRWSVHVVTLKTALSWTTIVFWRLWFVLIVSVVKLVLQWVILWTHHLVMLLSMVLLVLVVHTMLRSDLHVIANSTMLVHAHWHVLEVRVWLLLSWHGSYHHFDGRVEHPLGRLQLVMTSIVLHWRSHTTLRLLWIPHQFGLVCHGRLLHLCDILAKLVWMLHVIINSDIVLWALRLIWPS